MRLLIAVATLTVAIALPSWAQDRSVVLSYKTDTPPTIDGEIDGAEWDAAGPWITVTADSPNVRTDLNAIAEDLYGGSEDASFRFKTMWEEGSPNFYIVYEVFDDIAMEEDPVNPWEVDQIETFIDGNELEGSDDANSYHWWDNVETYGKLGVSRNNTFEGNTGTMTADEGDWDEGFGGFNSISAVADMGTNADYRIELGVSIIQMLDDVDALPFEGTPTEEAGGIVEDSTVIKYTAAVSDDDNFLLTNEDDTTVERSHVLTYYREIDGVEGTWDQSNNFANLTFTGEFTGVIDVPGDCDGDGSITAADLACVTGGDIDIVVASLGILAGDLDGTGGVGFPDFLVLSANFGQDVGSYGMGDINGDGNVGFPDFLVLSANFGKSAAATTSVPEPSGWALASVLCLLTGLVRRRRA